MEQLKRYTIGGAIFVLIIGPLAHFLYEWTGNNPIIGLFVPVNESVWEHMKLLFFPMLAYSFAANLKLKSHYPCIASSLCIGILAGTSLIPVLFYAYTYILGKNILILDIGTFVLSTIIAFYVIYKLTLSCRRKPYTVLLYGLLCILFVCFLLFTYQPPKIGLFDDPAISGHP